MKYRLVQLNNDIYLIQEGAYDWKLQATKWSDLNTYTYEGAALKAYEELRETRNSQKIKRIIKEEK